MMNQKTYSFIIKFLIFASVFLSISILVQSFMSEDDLLERDYSIPFLKIEDSTADSIINTLSIDEKVNLFVRPQTIDSTAQGFSSDTILTNNGEQNQLIEPLKKSNCFNSTPDTTLIIKQINAQLNTSTAGSFVINLHSFDVSSTYDSLFVKFYMQRLALYKKLVNSNHSLFGIKINPVQLAAIDSLKKDSAFFTNKIAKKLETELDFVLIDSFKTNIVTLNFQGILAANIKDSTFKNHKQFEDLVNGKPDVLIVSQESIELIKQNIKDVLKKQPPNSKIFHHKLRKLVKASVWQNQKDIDSPKLKQSNQLTEQQLVEKSICLLNNQGSLLPIKNTYNKNFVIAWIGKDINTSFTTHFKKYTKAQIIHLNPKKNNWQNKLNYYQKKHFIVYVIDTLLTDTLEQNQLNSLINNMHTSKSLFINFGNFKNLSIVPDSIACLQTCDQSNNDYKFAAQAIFGGIACQGGLPFNISKTYGFGEKFKSSKTRLKYTIPEDAGLNAEKLKEIDKIAWQGINSGAFPGCQVFVAKDGKVVLNKSYGYHTYSRKNSVKNDDVYDLASVTKIAATTIAAMQMVSQQKISLYDKLGNFFKNTTIDYTRIKPDTVVKIDTFFVSSIQNWKKFLEENDTVNINDTSFITRETIITKLTPKRNIFKVPIIALLRHKSGITPAVPVFRYMYYKAYFIKQLKEQLAAIHGKTGPVFNYKSFNLPAAFPDNTNLPDSLKQAIKDGFKKQYEEYFSNKFVKDTSDIQLTKTLYFKNEYFDTIWRDIKQLPVFSRKVFQYSDINMVLLQMAIDSTNNKSIDNYLKKTIYKQLGLKTTTYLPLRYYGKHKIIPTEQDKSWRFGLLHGFVHDPSAALLGGMTGNAGLYSNAHDLGILFQMVLNKGAYGGQQLLQPSVVETFTRKYDDTQRGLGFDMPNRKAIVGKKASKNTFGHSGYTGTCVWVDPDNQLVYVFLSNRNHPNSSNWRIIKYNIRERIHDAIYDAFIKEEPENKEETQQIVSN